ncbi:hypothetical protein AMTR_s00010p00252630 [Amborella trichopoda]|uniref:Amino acid transporter transmembrane domain-containing protein n=1 Tax=Amborella trichopoda TaxID=13333 RepID=W1NFX7_AMBTC|nr:hypothetical protein AMTR_s00010p00252630 [Amborella trichopoda]
MSLLLLVLVAIIAGYTASLLIRCMQVDPKIQAYPDIANIAFGHKGKIFVSIALCLSMYMIAVEQLIIEGDNLENMFPNISLRLGQLKIEGRKAIVLISSLIILPTVWLRGLGPLAYVSACGFLAPMLIMGSVVWVGLFDGVGFHPRKRLFSINGLPTTASIFAFCFSAHGVLPTISASMKDKSKSMRVIIVCFTTAALSYAIMAVSVEEAVPICKRIALSLLFRTMLVASTAIVAITVPFFGYLLALGGSALSSTLNFVLPCLFYLKITKNSKHGKVELGIIVGIVVMSSIVAVLGTYTSMKRILQHL